MSRASNLAGFSTSISPPRDLSVGVITAVSGTFSGNVSIAGTLTYEDVTNIDSVGLITARSGIIVTSNGISAVGVITATSFNGDGAGLTGLNIPASSDWRDSSLF